MPDRRADIGAAAFVLLLGLIGFWQAIAIPTSPIYAQVGPKAVPFAVATGLTLLGGLLMLVARH